MEHWIFDSCQTFTTGLNFIIKWLIDSWDGIKEINQTSFIGNNVHITLDSPDQFDVKYTTYIARKITYYLLESILQM